MKSATSLRYIVVATYEEWLDGRVAWRITPTLAKRKEGRRETWSLLD
ncbi:hypothetical protein PF005_g15169 [Phytophthora fragariae]|uniref:Uncharacterized protein n=1 Tax=Phytophthora fragariae TaxID=53985 RepID=A0A6A3JZH6_9STRA|nr:hypothetical protein PF003_g9649 [Phytophthora fragariae]KAE8933444.1 hypothetical protein PF009_g16550 [Phytophthora fragariae]KAE9000289.1 hypothetical protein PF011_g14247 [Phytophthora fragariae]KAE9100196.1 hypothetical protein PF007_g15608 [Phytophthora fragariae]KAE9100957.1 hypothetical protein PF010_g14616 [Phytophthora fragariae]